MTTCTTQLGGLGASSLAGGSCLKPTVRQVWDEYLRKMVKQGRDLGSSRSFRMTLAWLRPVSGVFFNDKSKYQHVALKAFQMYQP